ncbi:MAG: hypothetical protein HY820_33645 [Acidobacteria bacterium]|nr:hypothetical protein [Acidobacteriota bacterium]
MTVTKDVIHDLMPLYLAGEASDDTRRLVEEYLRAHPEELPADEQISLPTVDPPAAVEMASLDRARKLYGRRSVALASALALSYAVFSFRFNRIGLSFVLFRDLPAVAWVLLAAAAMMWVVFVVLHLRWAATGLAGGGHFVKGVWMMGGALAGLAIGRAVHRRAG